MGILLAKVGPMLRKYSLNFPTIAHLSVISSMPLRKKSVTGTVLFLFKICLIVCQVCRLLDLYASIFFNRRGHDYYQKRPGDLESGVRVTWTPLSRSPGRFGWLHRQANMDIQ